MGKSLSSDRVGTSLTLAAEHLRRGGIVAFPTETYYGLAVDPDCALAVTKVFAAKQRQEHKPLLLLIENKAQLTTIVQDVPQLYEPLMKRYWPGPLTLIFRAQRHINPQITGQTGTVGIRISPHPVAEQLVQRMGKPITATSANISGLSPARSPQEVIAMLGDRVDYIVDGGITGGGLCSTVVGIRNNRLFLFRRGQLILSEELAETGDEK
ncbi:L-threonylcarbamoyladenylate synthase [Desulfopila sp. IMCC35006]|uniref:L-threonylcarbamoyladenylate synthase n=1 Tax=Desulfopila sp. IMCC35006 TaxID=2569542 RepID=UPI00142EA46C|nr:L-threonylcarbamoyladenylate synthase [Desulfopila sp. IMCC35006]